MIIIGIATILALYMWGIGALMGIYLIGCVTMLMFAFGLGLIILHIIKGIIYNTLEQIADDRAAQRQPVVAAKPKRRKRKQQIQYVTVQGNALIVDPKQLAAATAKQQLSTNAMVVRK